MKKLIIIILIGMTLIFNSCKDRDGSLEVEEWKEIDITIDEFIEASKVIDSTLIITTENFIYEVNTQHEVNRIESQHPEYWHLIETFFSDKLLLRIFAIESLTYFEFRPLKNLTEKYVVAETDLDPNLNTRALLGSETTGIFTNSTNFVFTAKEFTDYREFIIELNVQLNESTQTIENVDIGEMIFLPNIETDYVTAEISNVLTIDEQLFLDMGFDNGMVYLENGQLNYDPNLNLCVIYKENENWYSIENWDNSLQRSTDQGMTWEQIGIETKAGKFKRIGNQTLALSKFNEIFMVGDDIENIQEINLIIPDDERSFEIIEFFNNKIYLGYNYYSEGTIKFIAKETL